MIAAEQAEVGCIVSYSRPQGKAAVITETREKFI